MDLHCARMIEPFAYMGLFDWILFCKSRKVRVQVWFGDNNVDLMSLLAPGMLGDTSSQPMFDVIGCHIGSHGISEVKWEQWQSLNHFVFARPVGTAEPEFEFECGEPVPSDASFTALYRSLGLEVVYTVADGRCAGLSMTLG